jgi:isoleucyl-tRNA synthetase
MDAWYFAVEKIKPELLRLNETIRWTPEHVKHGRFGKWLEGARDWNISRSRYWGTPIPVWVCENNACGQRLVLGSRAEIAKAAGREINDLHKEHLDEVFPVCPACGGKMRRVPEVLDCWFESGAMPYGQCHYPFENREWFETHFPADFIIEYPGQIRGWFYYLHVLAVALMGRAAFKQCLVHGTLLAADGTKISKSRKNFTDPMELIDRHGADALRLYLLNSPAVAMEDMNFKDAGVPEQTRRVLLPLWNVYSFFVTYANIDGYQGDPAAVPHPEHPLDRWILAVLKDTACRVTEAYHGFTLNHALAPLYDFLDDLTNWYVRRSRERFWGGGLTADKRSAYDTLYYVLVTVLKLLAPAAPFLTDVIYRNLTGEESVHLADWPTVPDEYADAALVEETRLARLVVSLGLALRQQLGIRVRQPLATLSLAVPPGMPAQLTAVQREVIAQELNVKEIVILRDHSELAELRVTPDARSIGPIWGRATQRIIRAAKAGQARADGDKIIVFDGNEEWPLERAQVAVNYVGRDGAEVMSDRGVLVALDSRLTPELEEEGLANELNRLIQDLRKRAGYAVSDRIRLALDGELPQRWREHLAELALAELADIPTDAADAETETEIAGRQFRLAVCRR